MKRMRPTSCVLFVAAGFFATAWLRAEVPAAGNWISNPSFEEGEDGDPVDWVFFRQQEKTMGSSDASAACTGMRGVAIRGEGGQSFGRWITPYRIPLEPATKYRVSFWYRGKGAEVYLTGHAVQAPSSGNLAFDLGEPFDLPVAKPAQSEVWTFVEAEITSPNYPAWAQLCLSGGGGDYCAFDDVAIERPGLTLLAPQVPQVIPSGAEVVLKLNAPELREVSAGSVAWRTGAGTTFKGAVKNGADGTWELTVAVDADADLFIEATGGARTLQLAVPKFFRVTQPGSENLFAFAAITDAHFYRPGDNERNVKFARVAATLNALDPLFVISLGDQMENHNGLRDEENKWICEAVREQLGTLAVPVFTLAGNHEIDRTYEGVGTRWYHEKYLVRPRNWAFRVGKTLFAGLDVSTPGVATREHGASFLDAAQDAWLDALLSAPRNAPPIIAAHISPFNEWTSRPDRDRFLSLLLGKKVGALLTGHTHYTEDVSVPNGQTAPPWPQTQALSTPAQAQAALDSPDKTTILTTTTACSFSLGTEKTTGYRYLLVRNGKIAWQAVLPASLEITRAQPTPWTTTFTIKAGPEKSISGMPLRVRFPRPGIVSAQVNGGDVACTTDNLGDGSVLALVQADVAASSTVTATISFKESYANTAPEKPRVTVTSSTSVMLTWTDNFETNTSYRVRCSADGVTWSDYETGATASSFSFAGLIPGKAYRFQVRAEKSSAPAETGLWSAELAATPSAANSWIQEHFGVNEPSGRAAWTADPDGDGLSNLMEYALGHGPADAADWSLPIAGSSAGRISLSFTPEIVSGLSYIIEASSDLSTWEPTDITSNLMPRVPYTHTDPAIPSAAHARRFLRLKITNP